ncbi:hypothetical protein MMC07_001659 [Pseudocyphellaria aurata]|nr:hypothetical protein [Pseudocyphellaria aurata]
MESISVYGYNQDLCIAPIPGVQQQNDMETEAQSYHKLQEGTTACPLLGLPLELRVNIYSHLLPTTVEVEGKGVLWQRGNIKVLSTCKQIYHEAIKIMYEEAIFVIDVAWDGVTFAYQWLLSTGLMPKTTLAFPDSLAWRNLSCVKKLHVRIHQVDSYTGMMKYNYAGRDPLTAKLKEQVETLCKSLKEMTRLRHLGVDLQKCPHDDPVAMSIIMQPFTRLRNLHKFTLSGNSNSDLLLKLQA